MLAETVQARRPSGNVDLRRTDAHPDHWYPIAWSRELKPGRMLARRYAGEPVVVVRGRDGCLFDLIHRCRHRRQMGTIKARCLGRRHGADWAEVDYTFSRTEGASTIGEGAIVGLMRKQGDGDNTDLMSIRTEYPHQRLRVWVG